MNIHHKFIKPSATMLSKLIFALLTITSTDVFAATFTVNSTADTANPPTGVVTLRSALLGVNQSCGSLNTINFALPTSDPNYKTVSDAQNNSYNYWSIQPTSALPKITCPVAINGFSQSGVGVHAIELSGASMASNAPGLLFVGINTDGSPLAGGKNPNGSSVKGLVINKFPQQGIYLYGVNNMSIIGNYIGLDVTGTLPGYQNGNAQNPPPGASYDSIRLEASNNNYIGTTASDVSNSSKNTTNRNVLGPSGGGGISIVSLNQDPNGLGGPSAVNNQAIGSSNNVIQDNYIGTDKTGTNKITRLDGAANNIGVFMEGSGSTNNTLGGAMSNNQNIIIGNSFVGVWSLATSGAQIIGNTIKDNGFGGGIILSAGANDTVSANTMSGTNGGFAALFLTQAQNLTFTNNIIDANNAFIAAIITDGFFGVGTQLSNNDLVKGNQFANGIFGIMIDNNVSGYKLQNNTFPRPFIASDIVLCGPTFICLGDSTLASFNNTVITNNFATTVIDAGNNSLLGTEQLINNPNVPSEVKTFLISNSIGAPQ